MSEPWKVDSTPPSHSLTIIRTVGATYNDIGVCDCHEWQVWGSDHEWIRARYEQHAAEAR